MLPHQAPQTPREVTATPGRPRRWVVLGAVVLTAVPLVVGWHLLRGRVPRPGPKPAAAAPASVAPSASPPPPASPAGPPSVALTLGKGRTFEQALRAQGLSGEVAARIIEAFRPHMDFRRLRPEDALAFHQDAAGALTRVVYQQSPVDILEARRAGNDWTAARRDVPIERKVVPVAGTLEGTLFESIEALGEQAQLVLEFAEIFAWDFDFAADSQPGDRFRLLVEKVYTGEQFVRYGRILAAEYESAGKVHTGIYFQHKGESGYYTPDGESLRRAFLKSPLEFTRISSGFSRGRRHPILGGVRPHLAVDYAAPTGTPVWAVADGTVEFVGWKGGNGKSVILRHRANFKTMYNHLSRFGKGVRRGATVTQRQVIGYVGSTGLSTGPHLDYRVIKDGRFVNPLKQTFLPGKPIARSARAAFEDTRDSLLQALRSTQVAETPARPKS